MPSCTVSEAEASADNSMCQHQNISCMHDKQLLCSTSKPQGTEKERICLSAKGQQKKMNEGKKTKKNIVKMVKVKCQAKRRQTQR